jgi:hypothetical protein
MLLSFLDKGSFRYSFSLPLILRKIDSPTRTTAPKGRFLKETASADIKLSVKGESSAKSEAYIQKHHLHVLCSVKAPPRGGPMQTAMTKTLITIPMYNGLFSSETT